MQHLVKISTYAKEKNVSVVTVYRWIASGTIPETAVVKIDKTLFINKKKIV